MLSGDEIIWVNYYNFLLATEVAATQPLVRLRGLQEQGGS
jgi:hypothetical protein